MEYNSNKKNPGQADLAGRGVVKGDDADAAAFLAQRRNGLGGKRSGIGARGGDIDADGTAEIGVEINANVNLVKGDFIL